MKLGFIGDVHGDMKHLHSLIKDIGDYDLIMQVGDMGAGFTEIPEFNKNVKWIRGNHDNPAIAKGHPNYIGEYGYTTYGDAGLFFLGGAWSIDRNLRIEGRDWWPDEELNIGDLNLALNLYEAMKPEIIVTHDCPFDISSQILKPYLLFGGDAIATRTGQALQAMWEAHKPKHWIFGHYHIDKEFDLRGTKFRCVSGKDVYTLEV